VQDGGFARGGFCGAFSGDAFCGLAQADGIIVQLGLRLRDRRVAEDLLVEAGDGCEVEGGRGGVERVGGLGSTIVGAAQDRDIYVVLGLTLIVTFVYGLASLLVDISYAYFNPRVRLGDD
jgi:hypothetical protein